MKRYDKDYFDRWYRDPRHQVVSRSEIARRALHLVATAEKLLERPVARVLDVCCGEGPWREALLRLRPRVSYRGVDSSPYVVERYGKTRGILLGTFGTLDAVVDEGDFDLILCIDSLQYIPDNELAPGLGAITERLRGVACIEAFTTQDRLVGDKTDWHDRTPAFYQRVFSAAGLTPIGLHCWVPPSLALDLQVFERGSGC